MLRRLAWTFLLVGCSGQPDSDGTAAPPAPIQFDDWPGALSATGLVEPEVALTPAGFTQAPNLVEYAPRDELWINGAVKVRQLVLPEGSALDPVSAENWQVPDGTIAFKTLFFAEHADGSGQRPVETRALRRTAEGLDYAVYLWNDAGTEATLADGVDPVPVAVIDPTGAELVHQVPSHFECRQCHESSPRDYLGVTEHQLAGRSDAFVAKGWLEAAIELDPGSGSDRERAVLGFFYGNCSHCHNDWIGPNSTYSLLPDAAFDNIVDQPTEGLASAPGLRVAPGDPEQSVLFLAVAVNDPEFTSPVDGVRAMPPLGVELPDRTALDLLRGWIAELSPAEAEVER